MNKSIDFYQERLNLQSAHFEQIDHHDAMVGIVYIVTDSKQSQSILKICTRTEDYFREIYFLKYFAGKLPVPCIYQMIPPERNLCGAILMEHLPGRLLEKNDLTKEISYELGSLFARIHHNRSSGYGDLIKSNELNPDPRLHFTHKFKEELEECSCHLPKTLLDKCQQFYDTNILHLADVDGPCIVHRDFRLGNIIIDNGKLQGIIDWSSARAGFAEEDFCRTALEKQPFDSESKNAFLMGYSSIRTVPNYNKIMPILKLSRIIAILGFCIKEKTWDNKNAKMYQTNYKSLKTLLEISS